MSILCCTGFIYLWCGIRRVSKLAQVRGYIRAGQQARQVDVFGCHGCISPARFDRSKGFMLNSRLYVPLSSVHSIIASFLCYRERPPPKTIYHTVQMERMLTTIGSRMHGTRTQRSSSTKGEMCDCFFSRSCESRERYHSTVSKPNVCQPAQQLTSMGRMEEKDCGARPLKELRMT